MQIDYLSADGHKWLLGPEGAGIFYLPPRTARTHPPPDDRLDERRRRPEFRQTTTTPSAPTPADSNAAATTSPDCSPSKPRSNCSNPWASSKSPAPQTPDRPPDRRLAKKRLPRHQPAPRRTLERHRQLRLPSLNHEKIFQDLRNNQIEIAVRVGRLRCSPHFYNTESQIYRLIEALPGH